jgi:D-alanyl-lipoteichoic acid acyltransferase DltB (MBOAT superfamily)
MRIRNTFIIFIVSGFWHGANWTFIIWGALNAIYFLPLLLSNNNRKNLETVAKGKLIPSLKEISLILVTFGLTVFAWIFFRAENISHAINYISEIFSTSIFEMPEIIPKKLILILIIFITTEWLGREGQFAISHINLNKPFRWLFYFVLILVIYFFGNYSETIEFIYFQF